jgi:hypothetical protein
MLGLDECRSLDAVRSERSTKSTAKHEARMRSPSRRRVRPSPKTERPQLTWSGDEHTFFVLANLPLYQSQERNQP